MGESIAAKRSLRFAALAAGVGGALLFLWSIRAAGASAVRDGVSRIGWWFVVICLLGGIRYVLRAVAWRMCLDDPSRLPLGSAFGAAVMGDALGNVTPFGVLVSEPSKVAFVHRRVGPASAISAVTVENLFYIASVVIVFVCGTAALLLSFDVGVALRRTAYVTLGVAIGFALLVLVTLVRRVRVASALVTMLESWQPLRRLAGGRRTDVTAIEDQVFGFASRHPGRLPPLLALEAAYHLTGVLEIWLTVTLIAGAPVAFITAFVLEFVNRTITIAFQFVPMWLGVDEAGTGAVATALQLGGATGVGLALVRKARVVVWTSLGLGLFFLSRSWRQMSTPETGHARAFTRAAAVRDRTF
ncbi:MAG TPA: lysylphosphatidylglycerol synthase domain-containing protein [Vicinamibacterales bacterium]|nr:lysylphosphatidylglycerol synthase domain-containing protein [Vicinamibacterales bacterium]